MRTLIDANKLMRELNREALQEPYFTSYDRNETEVIIKNLCNESERGIPAKNLVTDWYECGMCFKHFQTQYADYQYCPFCGSKVKLQC